MNIRIPDSFPQLPPEESNETSPVYQMAYGFGQLGTSDSVFKLERGNPRYRYGQLVPVLPQFKAQPLYTRNVNTAPTNVPLTQKNPATSPFVNSTTGRVRYPLGPTPSSNSPDRP